MTSSEIFTNIRKMKMRWRNETLWFDSYKEWYWLWYRL